MKLRSAIYIVLLFFLFSCGSEWVEHRLYTVSVMRGETKRIYKVLGQNISRNGEAWTLKRASGPFGRSIGTVMIPTGAIVTIQ